MCVRERFEGDSQTEIRLNGHGPKHNEASKNAATAVSVEACHCNEWYPKRCCSHLSRKLPFFHKTARKTASRGRNSQIEASYYGNFLSYFEYYLTILFLCRFSDQLPAESSTKLWWFDSRSPRKCTMYVNCAIRVPFPAASTAIVLNFAQWLRRKVTMHRTRLKWVATSGQRTTDYLCVLFIVLLLSPASLCHHHPHHRHRQSQHSQPSTSNLHEFQSAFGDQQSIQWATWQQQHQQQSLLPGDQLGSHEVHYPSRPVALAQTKCVERCSCKWRSGKMWVECMEVGLHSVPRGLDSGTQVLYLTGNPLQELEARIFDRNNLRNLQRLYLSSCHLHTINSDAFLQLSNLIELDLAHNELTNLPTNSLVHCPILRKLTLAKNQIRAIKNSAFQTLIHLQSIDLSGNGIELIDSNAFYGLKSLKQLYLHENKLR